jgi:hypothetical protein
MPKDLPPRPSLDHLKHDARDLQRTHAAGDRTAHARVEATLPGHHDRLSLAQAQAVIAREYGVPSWPQLKQLVERRLAEGHRAAASRLVGVPRAALERAIAAVHALDRDALAALLLAHPRLVEVQVRRDQGSNLLHEACAVNPAPLGRTPDDLIAIIDLLIEAGIDLHAPLILPEGGHLGVAWFCLRSGSREVLDHVLARGANPNGCLFSAAYSNDPALVQLLQRYGANLEEIAHDETPLLHALKSRRLATTRALLALGANVNHADSKGATALHYAVRQYYETDVIALLLAHGASPDLRSRRGNTALDLARRMGRLDIITLLGGAREGEAQAQKPRGSDVQLLPFAASDEALLEETVAFYQALGFTCTSLQLDDGFASVTLGGAKLMFGGGGTREAIAGDTVICRCPPEVFARVRAAIAGRGIAAVTTTTPMTGDSVTIHDCGGLPVTFASEARADVAAAARLSVSDLGKACAFYEAAGFARQPSGETEAEEIVLELRRARIHLRAASAPAPGERALSLWLACEDFDAAYHRLKSRMAVNPPEVAFYGGIELGLTDPDGRRVTFTAPVTDI